MTDIHDRPPRVHPIVPGNPDEVNQLIRKSYSNRLSPAEASRLLALTWRGDEALERARAFVARHPDLAGFVPIEHQPGVSTDYERRRAQAVAAGAAMPEPNIAILDHLAAEIRATNPVPSEYMTLDVDHRVAFQKAVQSGDFAALIATWTAWLAAHEARNVFARWRASALAAFGLSTMADIRFAPGFLPELEAAVGGSTIASTMPINQRG